MPSKSPYFNRAFFQFLEDLKQNNQREWFQANKQRYEDEVRHPAQQFISDFGPELRRISPHFLADPRPSGGSMFRIYRDTRFAKDKSPYKTHVGIQFRHKQGKDVHAPGFYLHLEPGGCFAGVGIWHPDASSLSAIRTAMAEQPARWKRITQSTRFTETLELAGESLKRAPKGFDPDHALIEDLKRKDFIGVANFEAKTAGDPDFLTEYRKLCRKGSPLVEFLCEAVDVPF
ncbi:MAG: DUF2461 domain-containing protein [Thermoanaerobaculia bacterium]